MHAAIYGSVKKKKFFLFVNHLIKFAQRFLFFSFKKMSKKTG